MRTIASPNTWTLTQVVCARPIVGLVVPGDTVPAVRTNSITYVEWSYARDNQLGIAQVDNGSGPVELSGDSVGKAVASAKPAGTGNDLARTFRLRRTMLRGSEAGTGAQACTWRSSC